MRFLLIFVELLAIWNFLANPTKTTPHGEYKNENERVIIQNDTLLLIMDQGRTPIYANDTLAKCSIIRKDGDWYEINSFNPLPKAYKSLTITQTKDRTIKDSICFTVHTSTEYEVLEAEIVYYTPYNSIYTGKSLFPIINGEGHTIIARDQIKSLEFLWIFPRYPNYDIVSDLYLGIAQATFLIDDVDINKSNNVVIIDIPAIDDSYFQRYNVFHEYINVTNDYLLWRGKKYRRQ